MSKAGYDKASRGVLYTITCAVGSAPLVYDVIKMAQQAGWDVCANLTPNARPFIDEAYLAQLTGYPVRSEYRKPEDSDTLPPADALLVFPATFNTINKWALGISDTFALGLLCECTGLKLPILAVPVVRKGKLAEHPAFPRSLRMLRRYGVHVFYEPEKYPPRNEIPGDIILDELHLLVSKQEGR